MTSAISFAGGGDATWVGNAFVTPGTTSFTPTLSGSTTAGTGTYTTQQGYYYRQGNMVYVSATVVYTGHTGTGNILVTALPFTVKNQTNYNPVICVGMENITLPGSSESFYVALTSNTTQGQIFNVRSGATRLPITLGTSGTVYYSGWYMI